MNETPSIWKKVYDSETINRAIEEGTYYSLFTPQDYTSLGFSKYGEKVLDNIIDGYLKTMDGLREFKKKFGNTYELNSLTSSLLSIDSQISRLVLGAEPVGYLVEPLMSSLAYATNDVRRLVNLLNEEEQETDASADCRENIDDALEKICVGLANIHDGIVIIEQAVENGR